MSDASAHRIVLDRRVPLWGVVIFVVSLLSSAGGGVIFAARVTYRVDQLEASQKDLKDVPAQLDRLDERTKNMKDTLDRLAARP